MTNTEIDEAVARKLGWEFVPIGPSTSTGYWVREALRDERDRVIRPKEFPFYPDYCTDIRAAWEVVEFIRARGYAWNISESNMGRGWSAYIWYPMTEEPSATSWDPLNKIDTAPMAITLAFLKLP